MKRNKLKVIFVSLIIILGIIVFCFRDYLIFSPFHCEYEFISVSEVEGGKTGNTYVIDNGRKTLIQLNTEMKMTKKIDGGSIKTPFFYATHVTDDEQGNIYVSDIVYGEVGNIIQKERILRLNGKKSEIIYEWDYSEDINAPMQNGKIVQIDCIDGELYCLLQGKNNISFIKLNNNKEYECIFNNNCEETIEHAFYNTEEKILAVSTRTGNVLFKNADSDNWREIVHYAEEQIPMRLLVNDGILYYTDIEKCKIICAQINNIEEDKKIIPEIFYEDENLYQRININPWSGGLYLSDLQYIYTMDFENNAMNEIQLYTNADVVSKLPYFVIWVLFGIEIIVVVICIALLLKYCYSFFARKDTNNEAIIYVMIAVVAIAVGSIISYSLIGEMSTSLRNEETEYLSLFANVMTDQINGDIIPDLNTPLAYGNDDFNALKNKLDMMIDTAYEHEEYYYYVVYAPSRDGIYIDGVIDYEDTISPSSPGYLNEDNEYSYVLSTGDEYREKGEISAFGSFIYVDVPIINSKQEIVAILEVGCNNDQITEKINNYIIDNIYSVTCSAIVITMLVIEILFTYNFYKKKEKSEHQTIYSGISVPIRTIVFLSYMTMGMQDAFVVLLCSKLYDAAAGTWIANVIPAGVGAALPLSMELLVCAMASLFGGKLAEYFGNKKIMIVGFIAQAVGFVICTLNLGYLGILTGLTLAGLGLGLVYVAANTMAAVAHTSEAKEKGFADVSAGVMSGSTIGVGIGSVILSIGNYYVVYALGAVLMVAGLLLCLKAENETMKKADNSNELENEATSVKLLTFMFDKKIFGFFVFLLTPFMMLLAFKDYFFPMYVEPLGISEVRIGQIHLLCGMCVLYIGPKLAEVLIKYFKGKGSIILATSIIIAAMGIFVIYPSVVTAILGVALLYFSNSFAYTCQYYYFGEFPIVNRFGEGKAMGVYSMFESLGQTVGPLFFGAILMLGNQKGIAITAIALTVCLLIFVILSIGKEKQNNS